MDNTKLNTGQANRLSQLPLKCMDTEYPNKTGQVLSEYADLGSPKELHPAFYGCFDWHSSVHGHWSLVKLVKDFPDLENRDSIIAKLKSNISKENIEQEITYFQRKQEKSYERTYGWAWLLKLATEIKQWDDPAAKELDENLQPLSNLIVERYIEYLPKQNYPLRNGTHTNTAFGLVFAYDYAKFTKNDSLKSVIKETAIKSFKNDKGCPIGWEPSGTDFLSPCLEEIDLMRRILDQNEFPKWAKSFLPELFDKEYNWNPVAVTDRTDGYLVHLDGLNFSRAWVFYGLQRNFPKIFPHLEKAADEHMKASLSSITDGNYEGEHWLASFALYALSEKK